MRKQIHMFNGDSLLHQMGNGICGEKIVCRECLVEGNIQGSDLNEFFENRANYLFETYESPASEYFAKSKKEFQKLKNVEETTEVNLWFEDDLFCQCNFWFVCHLIIVWDITQPVYLVRPTKNNEYSFGTMSQKELLLSFKNRSEITPEELFMLHKLWLAYQQNDTTKMILFSQKLHKQFPFIGPAVYAHFTHKLGMPEKSIKQIMEDLHTREFVPVFKEFCNREAIYGFGDLQVKRLFNKMIEQENEQ